MNSTLAFAKIRNLGVPFVETADVAALLRCSTDAANKTLVRLSRAGLITSIKPRLWSLSARVDPAALVESLTKPFPSYVSLQSALFLHGMTSQIPSRTYVVTLGRTRVVRTAVGEFSIHHVVPEVFDGFDFGARDFPLATPEKALLDVFYLSATRARLFSHLPELELPVRFDMRAVRRHMAKIESARLRSIVERRVDALLVTQQRSGTRTRAAVPFGRR
jgi:hypothetical protein